jgi:hypothetical protein
MCCLQFGARTDTTREQNKQSAYQKKILRLYLVQNIYVPHTNNSRSPPPPNREPKGPPGSELHSSGTSGLMHAVGDFLLHLVRTEA